MKTIPLTQGKHAVVDDADFGRLSKYTWYAQKAPTTYYAYRRVIFHGLYDTNIERRMIKYGKGQLSVYKELRVTMARQIMGLCIDDPCVVDHIHHNGLDNRRSKLRICTVQQNIWNRQKQRNSNYTYKGVYFRRGKWETVACGVYVGRFDSEIEAAKAYDKKILQLHGEFACLNFSPRP